jgi:trans-aconitate 2-methyltransferase
MVIPEGPGPPGTCRRGRLRRMAREVARALQVKQPRAGHAGPYRRFHRRKIHHMDAQSDWNPDQYLKFKRERNQASIDLVDKIHISYTPAHIADIGCGPGTSGQILLQRWPGAELTGVDKSPAMIEKARSDYPQHTWILADALQFNADIAFDIIFSNATIQWIPHHKMLLEQLEAMLTDRGVIAVQLPEIHGTRFGAIIDSVSRRRRWGKKTAGCSELFTRHDYDYYYDLLSGGMDSIDMWETTYIHVMSSHQEIIEWAKGTRMKPYLDRLEDEGDKKLFEKEILGEVRKHFPVRENGKVLFPFKRLFFIGYK